MHKCTTNRGDSRSNWNLEMLVFEERGKSEYLEKNLSEQGRETNNKLNPHMTPGPGIEPGPHWWEPSALTTAPPLFPSQPNHPVTLAIESCEIFNARKF